MAMTVYRPATGVVLPNQVIPKTGGGTWPHRVDIYIPAFPAPQARRTWVCLHGGGGTKEGYASDLGVTFGPGGYLSPVQWRNVCRWGVMVFVQGQTIPTSTTTSWNNHSMNDPAAGGQDDEAMLGDLIIMLQGMSQLAGMTGDINMVGHSNGGMQCHRDWAERAQFNRYCISSGAFPIWWNDVGNTPPVAFTAPVVRPIRYEGGFLDLVLGTYTQIGSVSHLLDSTWTQPGFYQTNGDIRNPTAYLADIAQGMQLRVTAMNAFLGVSAETYVWANAKVDQVVQGNQYTTSLCDGRVVQVMYDAVGHPQVDHQAASGRWTMDDNLAFALAN